MSPVVPVALVQVALGLAMFGIAQWARVRVGRLVPAHLPEPERRRRIALLLRGVWACRIFGLVLIGMVLVTAVINAT